MIIGFCGLYGKDRDRQLGIELSNFSEIGRLSIRKLTFGKKDITGYGYGQGKFFLLYTYLWQEK